jgi:lysylphosphatidylglycerol synthetase-like protein (DUF2156 family)
LTVPSTAPARDHGASRLKSRALAVLAAVAAPAAIWLLAVPLLDNRLRVPGRPGQEPLEVGLPPVIVIALAAALSGWALLAALERLTRRARATWTIAAVVALALSFVLLADPATPAHVRIWLGLMHLAVAAVLIPALRRTVPE